MSMNVYLKESVRNASGFKSDRPVDDAENNISVNGIILYSEKGRLYVMLDDNGVIPSILVEHVDEISVHTSFSAERTHRETGVYTLDDAKAELNYSFGGKTMLYLIKTKGKKLDSVQALIHKIKTGSVRPTESYEGRQQGMSKEELEIELGNCKADLAALQSKLTQSEADRILAVGKVHSAYRLAAGFENRRWQFISKQKVAAMILAAINAAP